MIAEAATVGEGEAAVVASCDEPGCGRAAARKGKCWGHLTQLRRHGRTFEIGSRYSAWSRVLDAMQLYADAETDEEFREAEALFKAACLAYGVSAASHKLRRRRS